MNFSMFRHKYCTWLPVTCFLELALNVVPSIVNEEKLIPQISQFNPCQSYSISIINCFWYPQLITVKLTESNLLYHLAKTQSNKKIPVLEINWEKKLCILTQPDYSKMALPLSEIILATTQDINLQQATSQIMFSFWPTLGSIRMFVF